MARIRSLAIATLALIAAACGPNAAPGKSPDQAVHDAIAKLQTSSLKATFSGSLGIDTATLKNIPGEVNKVLDQVGKGGSVAGTVTQESTSRRSATVTAGGKTITVTAFDGHAFYSVDGTRFAQIPDKDATKPLQQLAGFDVTQITSCFSFHDAGSDSPDGVTAEHYSAPVDSAALQKVATLVGKANSQAGQAIALAVPFTTFNSGSMDVWVDGSGNPVRLSLNAKLSVDVAQIAAALAAATSATPMPAGKAPSGTLGLTVALDIHLSSVGGSVSVAPPSPDPTAPTFAPGHHMGGGSGTSPSATP